RFRFAPSPTGYLHVGGARTALYNYLLAKKFNGKFIFRVEDTDLERSTEESLKMQIEDLQWLGLNWDEGVHQETFQSLGEYGPYRQSERLDIYKAHAEKLIDQGKAYYCFLTDEEIEKQKQIGSGFSHIESPYRDLSLDEAKKRISQGDNPTVRLKVPKKSYSFTDIIRGEVSFPEDMVGDFILIRSNGMPVYNFCCAVDDALMKISHVFRAEEHLNNTLRQLMVIDALGLKAPEFGHLSIILGGDKQKLSKRHGATSCHEYKQKGFMPEALINFMALLGWSPATGEELLTREQLIEKMDMSRFVKSSAVFDEKKLKWMNSTYLRALTHEQLWIEIQPVLSAHGIQIERDKALQALELFKPYMEVFEDAVGLFEPLVKFEKSDGADEVLQWEESQRVVSFWIDQLKSISHEFMTGDEFKSIQDLVKKHCEVKGKTLFMPLRVVVIGRPHGPDLSLLAPLIPIKELLLRAEKIKSFWS
ncbi:MAG: glutamate--tRNA ligase, partial [Bdellovibrionales bacterium]|nr:glutamate--tRNA ligase [Bdellovibrionales bacterium]